MIRYLLYSLNVTLQLFIYTWPGHQLCETARSTSNTIYNINWTDYSPHLRYYCRFMMWRSQKIKPLRAFYFFDCDLKSFMKILNTALSIFTLMQAVEKRV